MFIIQHVFPQQFWNSPVLIDVAVVHHIYKHMSFTSLLPLTERLRYLQFFFFAITNNAKWTFWYMSSEQMCNGFSREYARGEQLAFNFPKNVTEWEEALIIVNHGFHQKSFPKSLRLRSMNACLSRNTKIYYSGKLYFKIGLTSRRPKASLKLKETHLRE